MPLKKYESMKEYNGTVEVNGDKVEIKDGVGEYQGDGFFVSKDGMFVINPQRQLLGTIRNGKFHKVDKKLLAELDKISGRE